jgi:hypothetical protein
MVTGNNPEDAQINWQTKEFAENPTKYFDTNFLDYNGIDWVAFPQTGVKYLDPEEMFQNILKTAPSELTNEEKQNSRKSCRMTALVHNLSHSTRYLSVVDQARLTLAQNNNLYFKKGSLVYHLEQRLYFRPSDLLKQSTNS